MNVTAVKEMSVEQAYSHYQYLIEEICDRYAKMYPMLDADDLRSEANLAFVQLFTEGVDNYKAQPYVTIMHKLEQALNKYCKNEMLNRHSRQLTGIVVEFESSLISNKAVEDLRKCLSSSMQMLFDLYVMEQMTISEISRVLGVSKEIATNRVRKMCQFTRGRTYFSRKYDKY